MNAERQYDGLHVELRGGAGRTRSPSAGPHRPARPG